MKKIFDKWENLSITYKLFSITTSLLIVLAITIYLILHYLLPSYYHTYKIESLDESVNELVRTSRRYDLETLQNRLYYMSKEQNLAILLTDSSGKKVYGYNEIILLSYSKYILSDTEQDHMLRVPIFVKNNNLPYTLQVIMPLQPVDEATDVIRKLMPSIIGVAIIIGLIGAYIYSNIITKPLINIIEREREQESRRKDFVATISHELKTPITIISGQLEGMMYNVGKYKDRDLYLQKSYESTQELKDLVNEMMEVSKNEILEMELLLNTVNISELVERLVERQAFLIEEKEMEVILQIEKDINIKVDEERMTKAINNVINNAIKYSPKGEKLIVRLYKKNSKTYKKSSAIKANLEIENTGIKIEQKYLKEIFTPFYRIEKSRSRKTGGSGLGLYIVSQILKSHGFNHYIKNKENSVIFTVEMKN